MATTTATMSAQPVSAFNPRPQKRHAPARSSPLASAPSPLAASTNTLPAPERGHAFPTSRPLRPFASIAPKAASSKPVKIIEPPESFKTGFFMLDLTQAEFSRQD